MFRAISNTGVANILVVKDAGADADHELTIRRIRDAQSRRPVVVLGLQQRVGKFSIAADGRGIGLGSGDTAEGRSN